MGATLTGGASSPQQATRVVPLPINRFQNASGRSTVIEILKIWFDTQHELPPANYGATAIAQATYMLITTSQPPAAIDEDTYQLLKMSGSTVDYAEDAIQIAQGVSGGAPAGEPVVYDNQWKDPIIHDLTDGAGHGVLVATDQLFFTVGFIATRTLVNNRTAVCRILYRFKDVSLQEYIGIVQQQSQATFASS